MDNIKQTIQDEITNQQLAVGSLSTSSHTHNGVDSPKIKSSNLNTVDGFIFGTGGNNVTISYGLSPTFQKQFTIKESSLPDLFLPNNNTTNIDFIVGEFKKIILYANGTTSGDRVELNFDNNPIFGTVAIDNTSTSLTWENNAHFVSIDLIEDVIQLGTNNNFALQFPDAPRPSPVAGMMAFQGGSFYVCKVTGVWTLLI